MDKDFDRLLGAAKNLKGWKTVAEVARGLTKHGYSVSDQTMHNWKSRGVPAEGVLEACRIIGCRCEFVRSGKLPMVDSLYVESLGEIAAEAAHILDSMPREEQLKVLHYLQVLVGIKRLEQQ